MCDLINNHDEICRTIADNRLEGRQALAVCLAQLDDAHSVAAQYETVSRTQRKEREWRANRDGLCCAGCGIRGLHLYQFNRCRSCLTESLHAGRQVIDSMRITEEVRNASAV